MSKKTFSADVAQLLKLVTHSIYSNKEIFIRELIANANDAIQKAKILAASDANYLGDEIDFSIKISIDKEAKTLTLEDTGLGMTSQDVENHIGTIAKSGTKSFLEKLKDMKDTPNNLVGQFGIGFYSAFMVADKVEVFTKSNDSADGVYRSSNGDADYEIEKNKKSDRGTRIVLHLNDESTEYLEDYRIRGLIRKYAEYIPVAIMMEKGKEHSSDDSSSGTQRSEVTKGNPLEDEGSPTKEFEQINAMTAIWQKNKKDVTEEEYTNHFQSLAFSQDKPLDVIHLNIEGNINYKAVLYIPSKPNPFVDLNDPAKEYGPALYVQNVMIMDHCKDLLPAWMRHIVGIIETPDLPLNVSREILQQSTIMSKIQTSLIKEVIKSLSYIKKENNADYRTYFASFGRLLKEGAYYDTEKREEIASLLYFASDNKETTTLDEYIADNTGSLQGIESIYYLHTPSVVEGKSSPHLYKTHKRNLDTLLLTDPIDEYLLSVVTTYKGYTFINIAGADAKLPTIDGEAESQKAIEKTEKEYQSFLNFVTTQIGEDKLEKTSFGNELGDGIAVLHTPEGQPTAQMARMMKSMGQTVPATKKKLIINPESSLVKNYLEIYNTIPESEQVKLFVSYMYNQALLLEGSEIENMSEFLKMTNTLINTSITK